LLNYILNSTIKGRTQTVDLKCDGDSTAKWDLGGQWVTDTQTNITRIIKELNLECYVQFDGGKKILESGGKVISYASSIPNVSIFSLFDLQLMLNKINGTSKKVPALRPFQNIQLASKLDSMTFEQWLFASSFSGTSRSIVEAACRTLYGLEMSQVNALFANFFVDSAGSFERLTLCGEGCAQEKKIKG
jgi:monoamine oxidase